MTDSRDTLVVCAESAANAVRLGGTVDAAARSANSRRDKEAS